MDDVRLEVLGIAASNEVEECLREIMRLRAKVAVLGEAGRKLANEALAVLSELKDHGNVCYTNRTVLAMRVGAMTEAIKDDCEGVSLPSSFDVRP